MPKRFINVEFSGIKTRINVTGMDDLSEVQGAIKAAFSNSLAKFDAPHLLLYTNSNRDQLINTWAFFNSLSQEYFTEGGSCVVLDTLPLPTRESTQGIPFSHIQSSPAISNFWNALKACTAPIKENHVIQLPPNIYI